MSLHIATIGDGAMATVCSLIAAGKSTPAAPIQVRAWGRDAARIAAFNAARENTRYLPGIKLPDNLTFTADDRTLFEGAQLILCAVPTQYIRPALLRLRLHVPPKIPAVSVAKGIENSSLKRPSQIILELLGGSRAVAALSGPSIAGELSRGLPATMVTASVDATGAHGDEAEALSRHIQELFTNAFLRVYRNDDLLGVELAGAMKNVIAVAAGILDGMHAGNNAKAALLTRGLVEITRLGVARPQAETFNGLAGMGDLVTTCVSPEGRNRSFGQRVGQGEKPADVLASMVGVVEGVPTCRSVVELAGKLKIEMPISQGLHAVLFEGHAPRKAIANLMSRELKSETE